jgi:hypothetical protein
MLTEIEKHLEPEEFKARYFKSVEIVERQFTRYQWPLFIAFAVMTITGLWIWLLLDLSFLHQAPKLLSFAVQAIMLSGVVIGSAFVASKFDQQAYNLRDERVSKHHVRCYKYRAQHGDNWEHFVLWMYADACYREYNYVMGFDDDLPEWLE